MTDDRYRKGLKKLEELDGKDGSVWAEHMTRKYPALGRLTVEHAFGELWSRSTLSDREKEIVVIATLTAMGGLDKELASHVTMARKLGISREEIEEIMVLMSGYAGFPKAIHGLEIATAAQDGEAS